MGRLGTLVLIAVVVVVAYQQYCISQMRNGMYSISSKVHVERIDDKADKPAKGQGSDLVTSLAQAQHHIKQAKMLMRQKKTAQAQKEMDAALKNLDSANGVSSDIVDSTARFLRRTGDRAVSTFQKACKDISKEVENRKQ